MTAYEDNIHYVSIEMTEAEYSGRDCITEKNIIYACAYWRYLFLRVVYCVGGSSLCESGRVYEGACRVHRAGSYSCIVYAV